MRRSNLEDVLPLSPLQRGLLFHALFDDRADVYRVQVVVELDGELDPAGLESACGALLRRYPNLRAGFRPRGDDDAMQFVVREVATPWRAVDLSGIAAAERPARCDAEIAEDRSAPLPVGRPPLLRFLLLRLDEGQWRFVLTCHHIVLDGWSVPLVVRELFRLYADDTDLPEPVPFREHLRWIGRQDRAAALDAWSEHLRDLAGPVLVAPHAAGRAAVGPERLHAALPAEATARLVDRARRAGLTLNTVVQGAWAVVLRRATGRDDVVFGVTTSGRSPDLPGVERIIGLLINTLPVRVRMTPDEPVRAVLTRLQDDQAALAAHQHLGLAEVQRLAGERVLFDTAVVFENYPVDAVAGGRLPGGLRIKAADVLDGTHYPASLIAVPGERLALRLDHQPDLVPAFRAERLLDALVRTLEAIASDLDTPVRDLDRADGRECAPAGDDTARDVPDATLVDLVEAQVARSPDRVAVEHGEHCLSYAALNARANRLARRLAARGAGPESRVALVLPRSAELVVALLAVLKSGAAYVPVDPAYPVDRVRHVLADSVPALAVTTAATEGLLPPDVQRLVLDDTEPAGQVADHDLDDAERTAALLPEHPAYVLYTSGSTGRPKGVVGLHSGAVNRLAWSSAEFPFAEDECVVGKSSAGFVDGLTEVLGALVNGARLVLVDDEVARSAAELAKVLGRVGHSRVTVVPSLLEALLRAGADADLAACRLWVTSGEALPDPLAAEFGSRLPGVRLVNFYGASEASGDSLFSLCSGGPVAIGRPLWNTGVHVLDGDLEPVPPGDLGELYLSGRGLARGYHRRPDLTAERFLPCPAGPPGARMYRTGDLVRLREDGELEFVGRADDQVKIRGFRVEPEEVRSVLLGHPEVRGAAVVAREDEPGDRRLVAYVVPADRTREIDGRELRRFAREKLPEHMVPAAVVVLDALPLNVNGKLDRAALPAPQRNPGDGRRAPRTEVEEVVAGLFAAALRVDGVGLDESFFDLGGHSLSATSLAARLGTLFGVDVPVRAVFDAPTVAELADLVTRARSAPRPRLTRVDRPERVPLSFAQQRLWFLNRLRRADADYNESMAVRLTGPLDRAALEAALRDVVARHETLRTVYPVDEGVAEQWVLPVEDAAPCLEVVAAREPELAGLLTAAARRGFDLEVDPPLRACLFELGEREHVLHLVVHHIASDGLSTGPMARDVATAYAARVRGEAPAWRPLPVQYADYALWQQDLLGSLDDPGSRAAVQAAHWRETLLGLPDRLHFATDFERPEVASHRGAAVALRIDSDAHRALAHLAHETHSTTTMVVHAALATVLGRLCGSTDVPIGFPVAGRGDQVLEELVGFFVNTLVLRVDLGGEPTVRELVARVRRASLAAYSHQDLAFDQVIRAVNPPRSTARHPLFQVMVAFRAEVDTGFEVAGLTGRVEPVDTGVARFDLRFELREYRTPSGEPAGIAGSLHYALDLYEAATAEWIAAEAARALATFAADPDQRVTVVP